MNNDDIILAILGWEMVLDKIIEFHNRDPEDVVMRTLINIRKEMIGVIELSRNGNKKEKI